MSSDVENEKTSKKTKAKSKPKKSHDKSSGNDNVIDLEVKEHKGDGKTDLRDKPSEIQFDLRDKTLQFQFEKSTSTKTSAHNVNDEVVVFDKKDAIPSLYPNLSLLELYDD